MGKTFERIKQGLNEAIGHAKGKQAGVKVYQAAALMWRRCVEAWASRRRKSGRGSVCRWRPHGIGIAATATRKARRLCYSS